MHKQPASISSVQPLTPAEISFCNPIEHLRRAAKVQKLLSASDLLARTRGLDPERDAAEIFNTLTGDDFRELVRTSGVREPSSKTILAFLGELQRRARRAS